jgi:hypothetical protein
MRSITTMATKSITPRTFTNTTSLKNFTPFKKITNNAVIDFAKAWVEIYFIFMLAIGFFMSHGIKVAVLSYIIIFLSGLIFGRLLYARRKEGIVPIILIMIGYILGYVYGLDKEYGLNKGSTKMAIVSFFIIGNYLSYQLHKEKILI